MKKLGIVAGRGMLPLMLIKACQEQKRPFYVLALKDHAEPELYSDDLPLSWIRLGDVGKAIQIAHENNVQEVVMIGLCVGRLFPNCVRIGAVSNFWQKPVLKHWVMTVY